MHRIFTWLISEPDANKDPHLNTAKIVNRILLVILAGAALLLITGLIFTGESKALTTLLATVAITAAILLKFALSHGYVHLTATGLCTIVWLGFTVPVYLYDGIRDVALSGYFIVIAMTGLMLGTRWLLASTSASYVAILGAFYAEKPA